MQDKISARQRPFLGVMAAAVSALLILSPAANAWEINFNENHLAATPDINGIPQGLIIDNEYATPGNITGDSSLTATFTGRWKDGSTNDTNGWRRPLVLFDSNNPTGGDGDLGAPFTHVTTGQVKNPGNILIIHEQYHEQYSGCRNSGGSSVVGYTNTNGYTQNAVSCDNPDDNASGGRFEINFNKDITLSSIDFFDIEGAETTNDNEIKLFDANGNQIMDNAFYTPDTGGDNKWAAVDFGDIGGIRRIEIGCKGSCAIGDIKGVNDTPPAIPEPAGVGFLLAGLGWVMMMRRRRRSAAC